MILFFSGSGNSEYVAKYLANELQDEAVNLAQYLKQNKRLEVSSDKPYVLVSPVYVSVIPSDIERLLKNGSLQGHKSFYVVMTCAGSGVSAAPISAKRIVKKLGLNLMGVSHLSMPQNYLMYFKLGSAEQNKNKFEQAIEKLPAICEKISKNEIIDTKRVGISHKLLASRPMIKLFEKMLIGTKKFTVNDDCMACASCERICPKNVIHMKDGKPVWDKKGCMHCTACINSCPKRAINYGDKTKSMDRYHAPRYKKEQ